MGHSGMLCDVGRIFGKDKMKKDVADRRLIRKKN